MSHKLKQPVAHPAIPFGPLAGVCALLSLAVLAAAFSLIGSDDPEAWGMFTANWMYVLGLSQFGILFSAILRIVKARWGSPFNRIGEMASLAFAPLAILGFLFIFGAGREVLLYWVGNPDVHQPWLSEPLMLGRNLVGMGLFYWVAWVYYRASRTADADGATVEQSERARFIAGWLAVVFIVNYTLLAWDFGMMAIPHFHSSVYPLHIILGNLNGGTGYMLVLYLLFHGFVPDSRPLTIEKLRLLGILLTAFTLLWLYMFWAQFFVFWFGNLPQETGPLWKQMYGHFGPYFWVMMACVFFIPFLSMISAWVKKNLAPMLTLSLIVLAGVWLNRYLMVLTAVSDDHHPFRGFLDVAVTLGLPALHFLILLLWTRAPAPAPATAPNEVTDNG